MQSLVQLFSKRSHFMPKTQAQALAALGEGLVDEGAYIWKAVNIHPVFEEPWDLNEVERLLAKRDLDLDSTLLLMTIFERLIRRSDKERALFAAESINAIERRRMEKIQALRNSEEMKAERQFELATELRELGLICFARPVLKEFYLREALTVISSKEEPAYVLDNSDALKLGELEIDILIDLGDLDTAEKRLQTARATYPKDLRIRLLAAKVCFERRDYRGVACALAENTKYDSNTEMKEYQEILSFWSGASCHD